jgi:hypothetical protein
MQKHLWPINEALVYADSTSAMIDRQLHDCSALFDSIVEEMKLRYAVRVKRWRKQMSGCAWSVRYANGRQINWIESPQPRTSISLAIFLHEVGHHAIGFTTFKRRCEEEFHVWNWAMEQMRLRGIEPDERVTRRFELSMRYAVGKAVRRGIKDLPETLARFIPVG